MRTIMMMLALAPMAWGLEPEPGRLGAKLTVKDVHGGFAGFAGSVWVVEKNGNWAEAKQGPRNAVRSSKGRMTRAAALKLTAALKKYGASTLENTGSPTTNPRVVTITYGKHSAILKLPTTAALPPSSEKDMAGRFAGIVRALREALPKPEK